MIKVNITGGTLSVWDLLTVAFICFKVLGLIDWSWGKVFIPLYVLIGIKILEALISGGNNEN